MTKRRINKVRNSSRILRKQKEREAFKRLGFKHPDDRTGPCSENGILGRYDSDDDGRQ